MLTIETPDNFIPERTYILNIVFGVFLGLKYIIKFGSQTNYEIVLDNGNRITIQDKFFRIHNDGINYLQKKNIPESVLYVTNPFLAEKDIPAIYGTDAISITSDKIICGVDLFASSFFMLTRWEEHVNETRDSHDRFPVWSSLAYQNDFLDRPVVNEYAELLWNMLRHLGCKQKRKKRGFSLIPTHDVDDIYLWPNRKKAIQTATGDLLKRYSVRKVSQTVDNYLAIKSGKIKDPYDTFDELMDFSEKCGAKSFFFFLSGGKTAYDNRYTLNDPFIINLMQKINERGHYIGFHPSYDTYTNSERWFKEYRLLSYSSPQPVKYGRQHYLRFQVPITWEIWDNNEMHWDSSLIYAEKEGFRCGTCYEFSVFNVLTRKTLKLKEYPLIVMDTNFNKDQEAQTVNIMERIDLLLNRVKKYNGNFVFLWHNSNIDHSSREILSQIYQ